MTYNVFGGMLNLAQSNHRSPHVGECTLPLHVLAVACTMCNEALWKRLVC